MAQDTPGQYNPSEEEWAEDGGSNGLNPQVSVSTVTKKQCVLYLKYYANGGKGDPPSASVQTYEGKHKEVTFTDTVKDNDNFMTKDNSYFFGWANSSDGSVAYQPGDEITKTWGEDEYGTTRYNLYAKWRSSNLIVYMPDSYTIERHYTTTMKTASREVSLKGAVFTRVGYHQSGWATEEGGAKVYELEEAIVPADSTIQLLYPVWTANDYIITFHSNGGQGENTTMTVTYDSEFTIQNNIAFTRVGYHLDGWNEESDGSGSSWFSGVTYIYVRADNVDLYAVWAGDEYTVYYTDGTPNPTSENYIHSSKAVYGSPFYTDRIHWPDTKVYNTFNGWVANDGTVFTKQHAWFDAYSYASDPTWTLQHDLVISPIWLDTYSFGKVLFGERYSDEYGIYVEEPPEYTWPSYPYTHNNALGRNGDLLLDPDRFDNDERVYKISAYDGSNYYSVARKVSEWLHRSRSRVYIRLEDSYEPDYYRMAVYEESNALENVLAKAGKCELKFNCKPQKFLYSGDNKIAITTSGQVIHNPTDYPSKPLITVHGLGKIWINGSEIEILQSFNSVTFDAETYNTYDSAGRNMNRYIYTEDPILLLPGDNTITFEEGLFDIFITPRWWTI